MAAKQAVKSQPKVVKEKEQKSLTTVLPYKKASSSSMKAVTFAEHVEVVTEEEGPKIVTIRTRKISLPQRFKSL